MESSVLVESTYDLRWSGSVAAAFDSPDSVRKKAPSHKVATGYIYIEQFQ